MKKRSDLGFSLIELLVVIVILSIIFLILIFSYKSIIDNSNKTIDKQSEKMIFEAVTYYIDEFRHDKTWDEGNNDSNKTAFCITLQNLINMGYYKGDERNIEKWKDEYLVYVEVDDNSTYNYELISNKNSDVCKVYNDDVKLTNQNGSYEFVADDLEIANLEYKIFQKEENLYFVDNVLSVNQIPEIEEEIKSYITLVLDRSGSMKNEYSKEEKAARCLAARLMGTSATEAGLTEAECSSISGNTGLEKTEISLIEFALNPYLSRDFKHAILPLPLGVYDSKKNPNAIFHKEGWKSADGKSEIKGGTNTAYALMYAMMLNQKLSNNGKKFIILLYDGEPCSSLYYTEKNGNKNINYYPYDKNFKNGINTAFFEKFNSKFEQNLIKPTANNVCGINKRGGQDLTAVSNYLKENTNITLIVVGYRTNFSKAFMEMSSIDNNLCSDSSYFNDINKNKKKDYNEESYCYYKSDKNSLNALFNSLSNNLIREINKSTATKIKVILTPPENVTFIKNDEIKKEIIYEIDLVNKENNHNDYSYDIKINDDIFNSCIDDECIVEVKMFNAEIIYYNSEGVEIKRGTIENVPKLEFKYGEFLAIN